jgi:hypothetical protein
MCFRRASAFFSAVFAFFSAMSVTAARPRDPSFVETVLRPVKATAIDLEALEVAW